jgi:hypothetical protein
MGLAAAMLGLRSAEIRTQIYASEVSLIRRSASAACQVQVGVNTSILDMKTEESCHDNYHDDDADQVKYAHCTALCLD